MTSVIQCSPRLTLDNNMKNVNEKSVINNMFLGKELSFLLFKIKKVNMTVIKATLRLWPEGYENPGFT